MPILLSDGVFFGTLCGVDPEPHAFTTEEIDLLVVLARLLATYLERDNELSARAHAELALRQSEERYRLLAEQGSDVIALIAADGTLTYVSPSVEQVLGYSAAEYAAILADPCLRLVHPDDQARHDAAYAEALAGAERCVHCRFRVKDGEDRWVAVTYKPLLSDDHRPLGMRATLQDIHQQVLAEQRLHESEERFRALVQNASDVTAVIGSDGIASYVSPPVARTLGYPADELMNTSVFALIHPDDAALASEALAGTAGRPGVAPPIELRLRHRDGSWRCLEVVANNQFSDPAVGGIVINARDVTERKEMAAALAAERDLLQTLIDTVPDPIYVKDRDLRFVRANQAAADILGVASPAEAMGKSDVDFFPEALAREFVADDQRVITTGQPLLNKLERQSEDDATTRWVLTSKVPLRDRTGAVVSLVGAARNVTEWKRMEEALRESDDRFQAFMNNKPAVAYMKDETGRYVYVNQYFEDLYCPLSEVEGKTDLEWLPAAIAQELHDNDQAVLASGERTRAIETVPLPDGTPRDWLSFKFPFTDARGRRFVGGVSLDITEQRAAERDLARLAAIVESSNDAILGETMEGIVTSWNPAAEQLYGYSADEMVGRSITMLVPTDYPNEVPEFLARVARGERINGYETRRRTKDGRVLDVVLSIAPIRDASGAIIGASTIVRDVTDWKAGEEERERYARYASLRTDIGMTLAERGTLRDLLQRCMEAVTRRLSVDRVSVWLLDESDSVLELGAVAGSAPFPDDGLRRIPVGQQRIGRIAERRRPYLTNDLTTDGPDGEKDWAREVGLVSFGGYPMRIEDRLVGVLEVFGRQPLEEDTLDALRSVADILAQGIERKWAEELLAAERDLLQRLIDNLPDMIFIKDGASRFTRINRAAAADYGCGQPEDAVGKTDFDFFPEEVARPLYEREQHLLATGEPMINQIEPQLGASGIERWHRTSKVAVRDQTGAIIGLVGSAQDVTESRAAELELARLAKIVESSDDAITATLLDGTLTSWNPAAERLYGYTAAEAIGRSVAMLVRPDQPDELPGLLARLALGEQIQHYETQRVTRDGRALDVDLTISPLRDFEGEIVGASTISRNVTDQKRVEELLREAEARYRSLVEQIPAVTYIEAIDAGESVWKMSYISPQVEAMLGHPTAAWLDDRDFGPSLLHPDDRDRVLAEDARSDETGELFNIEYRMIGRDGRVVWIHDEAMIMRDDKGEPSYWLGFMLDISEQKRAEVETAAALATQQSANAELERLNRIKSDFVSVVSHEFRTPLTSVQGFSELIRDETLEAGEVREFADDINRNARRLSRMIGDMLDLDRLQSGRTTIRQEPVDLYATVIEVAETLRPTAPQHTIALDLDPTLPAVLGDRDRITQVFTNLLGNAIKYSPDGGTITITSAREGAMARVAVRDQGLGIPADALESVFERYARVESGRGQSIQGTGLGLPIAQEIVELLGGKIWAESEDGRGSVFSVLLPFGDGAEVV